jgi:hypothetical protein
MRRKHQDGYKIKASRDHSVRERGVRQVEMVMGSEDSENDPGDGPDELLAVAWRRDHAVNMADSWPKSSL